MSAPEGAAPSGDGSVASARRRHSRARVAAMALAFVGVTLAVGVSYSWLVAPAAGWCAATAIYNIWLWLTIYGMDVETTRAHARVEDPGRHLREALILSANIGGLGSVVALFVAGANSAGAERGLLAALALATVASSWLLLHTIFTLRYAALYFGREPEGGIGFNQPDPPTYLDIAYVAFSIGMTYQVSDNAIENRKIRATALLHSLLAFVFGTSVLATTLNLVLALVT